MHTSDGVVVRKSPLGEGELGVFSNGLVPLLRGTAVTVYPGTYRFVDRQTDFSPSRYKYTVTIQNMHPGRNRICVLDAIHERRRYNSPRGIGHVLNSSHPQLPPPYDKPNCFLTEESECEFDQTVRPPLVFVVALFEVKVGNELLLDYHWRLNGIYSSVTQGVLRCRCPSCG